MKSQRMLFCSTLLALAVLAGCTTLTHTITDPETGTVEKTEVTTVFRKGAISNGNLTVITNQTLDAEIIRAAAHIVPEVPR